MKPTSTHAKIDWTPEDRARHKAIREKFKDWHPGPEELLATGEYEGPVPQGAYRQLRILVHALRKERERQGLSLADVAERSGIDKAALSRLETGAHVNPTIDTLWRYAYALGKDLAWAVGDLCRTGQDASTTLSQVERALENATDLLHQAMGRRQNATPTAGPRAASGPKPARKRSGGNARQAKASR